jgi:hypothetical protein
MSARRALLALVCAVTLASPARAEDDEWRWGVTIWGVSYHVNKAIDYDERNWGAGLRYYIHRHVFVEGDALRNSNRGLILPVSVGAEIGVGTLFSACHVSAIAAATLAYYQNPRIDSNYFKFGPVPGVAFRCGRIQPNVIAVLSPSGGPLAAVVGSLTIRLGS